ncbi:hypothetical protein [Cerasicoccus frondis]|uniref:hypothetical protein n=1 Tax=Cerasicoccus frondis TaxID=490090 RepID=UPI002852A5AA|nr:hypothetical protein [Cerasicoccus frondis]
MKADFPLADILPCPSSVWREEPDEFTGICVEWVAIYNRNDPALMAEFYAEGLQIRTEGDSKQVRLSCYLSSRILRVAVTLH